jgi:preprotein translocase subunit SecB
MVFPPSLDDCFLKSSRQVALQTDFTIASVFEITSLESSWMRTYTASACRRAVALFARIAICMARLALLQTPACFSAVFKRPAGT